MIADDNGTQAERQPEDRADRQQDALARPGRRRRQRRIRQHRDMQRVMCQHFPCPCRYVPESPVGGRRGLGAIPGLNRRGHRAIDRQHVGRACHIGRDVSLNGAERQAECFRGAADDHSGGGHLLLRYHVRRRRRPHNDGICLHVDLRGRPVQVRLARVEEPSPCGAGDYRHYQPEGIFAQQCHDC